MSNAGSTVTAQCYERDDLKYRPDAAGTMFVTALVRA